MSRQSWPECQFSPSESRATNPPAATGAFTTLKDTNKIKFIFLCQSIDGDGTCWPGANHRDPLNIGHVED